MTDKYAVKMSLLSLKGDKQLPLEYESPCHSPKIFLLATSLSYESMKLQSFINIELISLLRLALPSPPPCPSSLPLSFLLSYKYMSSRLKRHIIKYDRKISYPCIVVLEFLCVYM